MKHSAAQRLVYADGTRVRINDCTDSPKGLGVVRQLHMQLGLVTIVGRDGYLGDFAPDELQKTKPHSKAR